ncbi:MAG: hypothetical protein ABFS34_03745 [Gemmatimonadota bacterium]
MRRWLHYAAASAVIVAAGVGLGSALAREHWEAFLLAGALALAVQLAAFGALVWAAGRPTEFLAAWAGGMVLRLGVVIGLGVWLTRGGPFAPLPTLLAAIALLFALALLEPWALRRKNEPTGRVT